MGKTILGTITLTFTVWCHICGRWENASADKLNKREAGRFFKEKGWIYKRQTGWICKDCRVK